MAEPTVVQTVAEIMYQAFAVAGVGGVGAFGVYRYKQTKASPNGNGDGNGKIGEAFLRRHCGEKQEKCQEKIGASIDKLAEKLESFCIAEAGFKGEVMAKLDGLEKKL